MIQIKLSCVSATEKLARDCAGMMPHGVTILLSGDLGAGKTLFARAFIRALMQDHDYGVSSPTFNLVQMHETPSGPVAHYDLYRIEEADDLEELGLEETLTNHATLIEWSDRLSDRYEHMLRHVVRINLAITDEQTRVATLDFGNVIHVPETAFVFAAGLGARMRPLTDTMPKPLVPVNGRPILNYTFDSLKQVGIKNILMNTHYMPDQVQRFASTQEDNLNITVLHEDVLLETGGGMRSALPQINDDVFFATNGDALLVDEPGGVPYLTRLAATFDPQQMDILLLLYPVTAPSITALVGDYTVHEDGRIVRSHNQSGTHMFAGARILHRRIFDGVPLGKFSFLELMDKAEQVRRLYGLVHTGEWHHLSTPQDVKNVTAHLQETESSRG